jgi:protein-tyrosine phosphatase
MIWARSDLQVLFVCTANICRSPLAEGLLRHRLRALNLGDRVQVLSAGTHASQPGCRPDPRVEELAAEAGFSLAGIRAKMLTPKLIQSSHYVLVMERAHVRDVERLRHSTGKNEGIFMRMGCTNEAGLDNDYVDNIRLLGSFLPPSHDTVKDIPDPYFGDLKGFYNVHQLIDLAVTGFLRSINPYFAENIRKHQS